MQEILENKDLEVLPQGSSQKIINEFRERRSSNFEKICNLFSRNFIGMQKDFIKKRMEACLNSKIEASAQTLDQISETLAHLTKEDKKSLEDKYLGKNPFSVELIHQFAYTWKHQLDELQTLVNNLSKGDEDKIKQWISNVEEKFSDGQNSADFALANFEFK